MIEEDLIEVANHRESYGKGYDDGLAAGQEAMRERCAAACDHLRQHVNPQACTCTTSRHHSPYCEGWQDALDCGESAIRALALEVSHD